MTIEKTKEIIEVMEHFANGGEVQITLRDEINSGWEDCKNPVWNWGIATYRKKQKEIDWSKVPTDASVRVMHKNGDSNTQKDIFLVDINDNTVTFVTADNHGIFTGKIGIEFLAMHPDQEIKEEWYKKDQQTALYKVKFS